MTYWAILTLHFLAGAVVGLLLSVLLDQLALVFERWWRGRKK